MFSIKSFFTYLSRNKLYTTINIFGFAASLTFVILMGLYIQIETSADANNPNAERIYRLDNENNCTWPAKLAADIENRYPEIQYVCRTTTDQQPIGVATKPVAYQEILMVDSVFFEFFPQQFIAGTPSSALQSLDNIVLSESYATKIFGSEPAVGQTITIDGDQYNVTAVVKDFEKAIIKNPDVIIRFENIGKQSLTYLNTYNAANFNTFIMVRPNATLIGKEKDMAEFFKGFFWMFERGHAKEVIITPLRDAYWDIKDRWHLNSNDKSFINILGCGALAILLFAVINYINLSVAQTTFRAKEATTRRLLGLQKSGLFSHFITEAIILCALSLSIAIMASWAAEPLFNNIMQSNVTISALLTPLNITILACSLLILGLISGLVPAYAITRYQPIQIVKGSLKRKSKMVYSKVLMCLQYIITIVLLGSAITIWKQTNYMMTTDLGFDREQILEFTNNIYDKKVYTLYDRLKAIPGVTEVSMSQGSPASGWNNNTFTIDGENYSFSVYRGDSLFMKMMNFEVIQRSGVINPKAVWLNQTAARHLNVKPDDTEIMWGHADHKIPLAGVLKDFHIETMKEKIGDVIIFPLNTQKDIPWSILVKINSQNPAPIVQKINNIYTELSDGDAFDSKFMDQQVEEWYVKQKQTAALVEILTLLALIISSMGILAMSTYFIKQRTSEIAVRKVFGSTKRQIFFKLIKQFVIIIAIACAIATPITIYFMQSWLSEFAYHITLGWEIFALAIIITFVIALTTISSSAYMAMIANPIKSLKAE